MFQNPNTYNKSKNATMRKYAREVPEPRRDETKAKSVFPFSVEGNMSIKDLLKTFDKMAERLSPRRL